jgi:predicted DNA-binding transcriptional regulator AlpA
MKTIMQKLQESHKKEYDYSKYGRKRCGKLYPIVTDRKKSNVKDTPASDTTRLTINQLLEILKPLGVSRSTLYKWTSQSAISGIPVHRLPNGRLWFDKIEIEGFLRGKRISRGTI